VKKLFLIAILSVGIISGVVLSPEIWAMIEPHITITMDPEQTTKPFQILDNFGDEVFSVDVDGTIFPPPPAPIDFGTEIVILDQSAKDGQSQEPNNGAFDPFGYAFDLPTSANLWKITAVEIKTGDDVSGTEGFCGHVWQDSGLAKGTPAISLPLIDGTTYAMGNVAWGEANDWLVQWTTDEVIKIPVTGVILEGGSTVVALAGNCGRGGSEFSGSSTTTESWGEFQGSNFNSLSNSLGTNEIGTADDVNFEYYMKVYAKPLG